MTEEKTELTCKRVALMQESKEMDSDSDRSILKTKWRKRISGGRRCGLMLSVLYKVHLLTFDYLYLAVMAASE